MGKTCAFLYPHRRGRCGILAQGPWQCGPAGGVFSTKTRFKLLQVEGGYYRVRGEDGMRAWVAADNPESIGSSAEHSSRLG